MRRKTEVVGNEKKANPITKEKSTERLTKTERVRGGRRKGGRREGGREEEKGRSRYKHGTFTRTRTHYSMHK